MERVELLYLGVGMMATGFVLLFVVQRLILRRIKQIEKKMLAKYIEHKDDVCNLQAQIRVIDPNLRMEGKPPIPILPVPIQVRQAAKRDD